MRLLFVQESDWLKRNPHQQHHLAEMLALRGHEIRVIDYELLWRTEGQKELFSRRQVLQATPKVHQGARITVVRPGIIKIPLLDYISLVFSHRREIRRQIREFAPQVIIGLGILNTFLAAREARKRSIPFIYYWLDALHKLIPARILQPLGRVVESRALRHADMTLALSERLREYVVALGAGAEKTRVLGAGINTSLFHPDDKGRDIRRQYGIEEKDAVLFFMGWLYHFSGIKEVTAQVAAGTDFKLLIVGDGDAGADLQKIQELHNASDRIILAGRKPYEQIPAFIAAADICLLPAYPTEEIMQDIVPIKVYEYMAMSKPVVATKLPGIIKEFGNDSGIVYVNGPDEVAAEAIRLVRSGHLKELGRKAREFVERRSWDNITDQFEAILKKVSEESKK
jgi:glycosyltransferase involved in cell wall biosynthesis